MTFHERHDLKIGDVVDYEHYGGTNRKVVKTGLVEELPKYPHNLGHKVRFFDGTKETIYDFNAFQWKKLT